MIFRIPLFDAEALKVWRGLLDRAKAPVSDGDLRRLYYFGKVKGFFAYDGALASIEAWSRFEQRAGGEKTAVLKLPGWLKVTELWFWPETVLNDSYPVCP
ncbi:hypothetical protein HGM15179_013453 [Zosterops borbonicus]|uniref:Uncharacterized protein n=1 Tax=Zosterops borbonicus TaxID=364589 RepID=A0A8K1LGZ0_9PASS|nr:hypothetical protein HGM15179_013453 [Zosterops borbonicus]